MNKKVEKSIKIGGRDLILSTGKLAAQATSAVVGQYGETVVLATVVASKIIEDKGYFPLSVEYQERLYAGGIIKGSRWVKREGRPTDEEVLKGRMIDRSIRPLFPKGYMEDVQVTITVLSVDHTNDPIFVAPLAVAAALHASEIPWDGPIGVVSVGMVDGKYVVSPTDTERENSKMDLVVSATDKAVVMIEAGASEVSEEEILGGIEFAQKEIVKMNKFLDEFAKEVGAKKKTVEKVKVDSDLEKTVEKVVKEAMPMLIKRQATKEGSFSEFEELKAAAMAIASEEEAPIAGQIFEDLYKREVRKIILAGKRPDGRKHDEIRKLSAEVGVLPRTHGSAVFSRGETQALSVVTLGSPSLGQLLESAEGEVEKRYMHHYSMPPYSTGETGRMGSPNRREIGHGALAERALAPVIPSQSEFPYAIRVVSEVMSSNGSTSMASTCGSTLALMDAGVPIKSPVAGMAMGLVTEGDKTFILTDIAGIEDFNGDMDFKVAGTEQGITAMQLDVKTLSLTLPILKEALAQAKVARQDVMKAIKAAISEPRKAVSVHAPKIKTIKIKTEKIGEVIGPGGKIIKKIIAETGAEVEVEDDGTVNISGINAEGVDKAVAWVESLVKEVVPGEIYMGTVTRLMNFGAFVEVLPGKEGLVHVSDMSTEFVKDPAEIVSVGQSVEVRVKEIDEMGRTNLTMILDPEKAREKRAGGGGGSRGPQGGGYQRRDTGPRNDWNRSPRGGDGRGPRRDGGRPPRRDFGESRQDAGGPHFPASRLLSNDKKDFG